MKWIHNLLKGLSLTSALFIFQACYGTPQVPPTDAQDENVPEEQANAIEEEGESEDIQLASAE